MDGADRDPGLVGGLGTGGRFRRGDDERSLVAKRQDDPTIVRSEWPRSDPYQSSGCGELVERGRSVVLDPRAQQFGLERRRDDGEAAKATERVEQRGLWPVRSADAVPRGQESRVDRGFDGFDLPAESSEGASAQPPEDADVAPFLGHTAGSELTPHDATLIGETDEHRLDHRRIQAQTGRELGNGKRRVGPGVAGHEIRDGVFDRVGEDGGQPARDLHPQRVGVAPRVLGRDQPRLAGHADQHRAMFDDQRVDPLRRIGSPAGLELAGGQVAELAQQIMKVVRSACRVPLRVEALEGELEVGDGGRVDEVAQLARAEQVGDQLTVKRERAGASLRQGRVTLVHVRGDPAEQQGPCEG